MFYSCAEARAGDHNNCNVLLQDGLYCTYPTRKVCCIAIADACVSDSDGVYEDDVLSILYHELPAL